MSAASEFNGFIDLLMDLIEAQQVPPGISWLAVEGTEGAHRGANVAVVDVSVDDIGDHRVRVPLFSNRVGSPEEGVFIGVESQCQRIGG